VRFLSQEEADILENVLVRGVEAAAQAQRPFRVDDEYPGGVGDGARLFAAFRGSFWTKMPYSPRTWASVSGEPVGPMMAGSKAETYLSRTSGVSRSGSTVTNR
jgi:hypothetical protein